MAWSTRELADLANTTVNTVRHYHRVGLLDLPGRELNGYKQYEVSHLVRLLRIRRLSDLGMSLAQVAALEQSEDDADEIEALDTELAATIERLTRVRGELAGLRRHRARADTPSGFAEVSERFTDRQRALLAVYSTVFSEAALAEFCRALAVPNDTDDEFEQLPVHADDATIEQLAHRMVPPTRRIREAHPRLLDPTALSPHGSAAAQDAMGQALVELYNTAQLRVLRRLDELLAEDNTPVGKTARGDSGVGSAPTRLSR